MRKLILLIVVLFVGSVLSSNVYALETSYLTVPYYQTFNIGNGPDFIADGTGTQAQRVIVIDPKPEDEKADKDEEKAQD